MMVDEQERAGEPPCLWDVVRTHMEEAGIESLEELHSRYLERGRKPFSLEEFKLHLAGENSELYGDKCSALSSRSKRGSWSSPIFPAFARRALWTE